MNKKKKTNKPKAKTPIDLLTILSIIGVFSGIIFILSIFGFKMGLVGFVIRNTAFFIMGMGAYFFPFALILISGLYLLDKKRFKNTIILVGILFFISLVIFDGLNPAEVGFISRFENMIILSKMGKGGGFIGFILGFIFYKLLGVLGTYIVMFGISFVSIVYLLNINVKEKFMNLMEGIKLKYKEFKNNKEIGSKKEEETSPVKITTKPEQEEKDLIDGESKSNIIEFKDYRDNKEAKEKPVETNELKENNKNSSVLPPIDLLLDRENTKSNLDEEIQDKVEKIETTMMNFGIEAKINNVNVGPTITCYELEPSPGIKLNKIVSLSDNIAMALASSDIRIEAPIPGKSAVGIEVPNKSKDMVSLKEIIRSKEFIEDTSIIPLALGKDVSGNVIVSSMEKMPHLLIAGATGSGKSVCINTILMSILYKSTAEDVKIMLIDPKIVELSIYNGIPHLMYPVITDPRKASNALKGAVNIMEERYNLFAEHSVRDIKSYNEKNKEDKMAHILIVIDELADLMMTAAKEVEDYICRLAQKARAAGIHLIVATQRPSVDVITGTIKANIPSRISFAVSSQIDSRTILDMQGAEKLLGQGDMLFYPSFYSKPKRIQGAFVSDQEVEKVVNFLKLEEEILYDSSLEDVIEIKVNEIERDDLLLDAINIGLENNQISVSLLQRKLNIGYPRAARIVDELENLGIIGEKVGNKSREIILREDEIGVIVNELSK